MNAGNRVNSKIAAGRGDAASRNLPRNSAAAALVRMVPAAVEADFSFAIEAASSTSSAAKGAAASNRKRLPRVRVISAEAKKKSIARGPRAKSLPGPRAGGVPSHRRPKVAVAAVAVS